MHRNVVVVLGRRWFAPSRVFCAFSMIHFNKRFPRFDAAKTLFVTLVLHIPPRITKKKNRKKERTKISL